MKQKIIFSFLFILAIILTASILKQPAKEKCAPALRLKYDFPAENWESQALPLGNGYMGAMIFGGVNTDLIQVNEHTIWSGGPGANPNYDGGHKPEAKEGEIRTSLQKARREIQRKMNEFSENHSAYIDENGNLVTANYNGEGEALENHIKENMGVKNEFGGYQTLGNIHIDNLKSDINYSNYQRSLDIDSALVKVEYVSDGAENYREYFMNYPENVMVVRYSSNKNNNVSRAIWIDTPQPNVEISAEGNIITMTGRPSDHNENGLNFAQQLIVINKNGDLSTEGDKILVEDADEIIILMSAASNYLLCKDESFNFFTKENPLFKVKENLEGATQYSYEDLKRNHIEDYVSLYEKMCFKDRKSVV